ncbi:MAG TPA: hypothetical protein VND22_05335, partial [Actinomycetota bacterium]|nr:hypothetical protein [Actinomycetota bacterium]
AEYNLPLRKDREQAWLDFWGWRVNYDEVLLGLARLTMAPPAPWSTDKLGANLTAKFPALEKREPEE